MRKNNVSIIVRDRGKITARRDGHNILVEGGRVWLSKLMSLTSQDPDVGERDDRIKYVGFGIGGVGQGLPFLADNPPFSVDYPAGADPYTTNGHEYNPAFPFLSLSEPIKTLERPIRITGGTNPYGSSPGTDQWLSDPTKFVVTHPTTTSTTFRLVVDLAGGEIVYPPYDPTPLSEIGLFTSAATSSFDAMPAGTPFNELVAYHTFATIQINSSVSIEIAWTIQF
jgi:hypothetical protein